MSAQESAALDAFTSILVEELTPIQAARALERWELEREQRGWPILTEEESAA